MSADEKKPKGKTLWGLNARHFPKVVQWQVDQDYAHKLNEEEREWLAKFNSEWHNASFGEEPIHDDAEQRREIYRNKNSANSDSYEIAKVSGRMNYLEQDAWWQKGISENTNEMTKALDAARKTERNSVIQNAMVQESEPAHMQNAPEYLNHPEYRRLLAAYREHLPKDRKAKTNWTPALKRAHAALLTYVKLQGGIE